MTVEIHGPTDFECMRLAGGLASDVLDLVAPLVLPGVTTGELDARCHDYIVGRGAVPAPLNYRGFPKSVCVSVNEVVCHGIPGERVLLEGDIANVDVTVILDGWHGDTSRTFLVGEVDPNTRDLVEIARNAMWAGIHAVRPGATLGDVGHAVEEVARLYSCSVVRDFGGHGIGRAFHEEPSVPAFGRPGAGLVLREGMFFTVEPMVNVGGPDVRVLDDGWTVVTRDGSLSAQFEHTLGVTRNGCEVFTQQRGR